MKTDRYMVKGQRTDGLGQTTQADMGDGGRKNGAEMDRDKQTSDRMGQTETDRMGQTETDRDKQTSDGMGQTETDRDKQTLDGMGQTEL